MAKLILKFKDSVLKEMLINKPEVSIGRHPNNDIQIDNPAVSGFHAKVVNYRDGLYVEDQNSLNGTFLNDRKVGKSPLKNNDVLTVGKHTIVFMAGADDGAIPVVEAIKGPSVEATMVLDTRRQKEATGGGTLPARPAAPSAAKPAAAPAAGGGEVLGGFSVVDGSTDKPEYTLTGRLSTIGKADNSTIKLKGMFAPKVAALINRTKEGYVISPPGDGSKIKVNGQSVEGRYTLKDGDLVEVASIKIQFFVKG